MITEIDQLLEHWAEQHRRGGGRPRTMLAQAIEFGGVPPRGGKPKGSVDPLGIGELDEVAWHVERALSRLDDQHQVLAHTHYRSAASPTVKSQRLGLAVRTYYDRLHLMHHLLKVEMKALNKRRGHV
ncbi:hypothetical protein [Chromohalobacter israelensis]|uniref:hypothetical protein n=1 Tax=Chromohalobacter israelensis TaxID=141390 RepID=UPI000FFEBDE9|nr:hypothetical protein [Chromohalobacter salexigens]RXE48718.1 hypothetical protein B4O83_12365 [Chromohalobacter salexigens]